MCYTVFLGEARAESKGSYNDCRLIGVGGQWPGFGQKVSTPSSSA